MNRFNLTFSGEIMAGRDTAEVKLRFAALFAIHDPVRVERFFSGETIILRRNLDRKEAGQYFQDLQKLGVVASLVKVTSRDTVQVLSKSTPTRKSKLPPTTGTKSNTATASAVSQAEEESIAREVNAAREKRNALKQATLKNLKSEGRKKRDAEAAAQKKEAKKRAAAERAATRKAKKEKEHARRALEKAAEEDRLRAQQEAKREREAEAAARLETERLTAEKQQAEEAARLQAELKQKQKREAEELARRQAEQEALKRQQAEEAARRKAELEAKKRREAEEAARRKAEHEETLRLEAEQEAKKQAKLEAIKREEAAEAARLAAEIEEIRQQEATAAARIKAEAQRKLAEAQRQSDERRRVTADKMVPLPEPASNTPSQQDKQTASKAKSKRRKNGKSKQQLERRLKDAREQRDQLAERAALDEQAIQRAAQELANQTTLKPAKARVKTNLDLPVRTRGSSSSAEGTSQRKRQAGEPNLYALRPFRITGQVRTRSERASRGMRKGYLLGTFALIALLITGAFFIRQPVTTALHGASAMASHQQSGPVLLAGNQLLLHDRAGVVSGEITLAALGVSSLEPPLLFDEKGKLFALGPPHANVSDGAQLLRCDLEAPDCQPVSAELQNTRISAFALHPLNGSLIVADNNANELLKLAANGTLLARAAITLPPEPVLRLHAGLLLMNSAEGPGISVFRYENNAFGKQLDEILLLPPAALEAEQSRTGDFIFSGGRWWASLSNPKTGDIGLYQFDDEWNYLDTVALSLNSGPLQLATWGKKTLVNNSRSPAIQRFNAQGTEEAPFVSAQLEELIAGQRRNFTILSMFWRGGLLVCLLTAIAGFAFGYLQSLRNLVFKPNREHGAEPVDHHAPSIDWIDPVKNRAAVFRHRNTTYAALAVAVLLLAIVQGIDAWQLAALLIALSGPAIALQLLSRRPIGNIGIFDDKLLLVDHNGMYHIGCGAAIQHRDHFLMIDDVVVFTGNRLLPAFSSQQLRERVNPRELGAVKIDRNTLAVKLLECGHPVAQGIVAVIATLTVASAVLYLHTMV